ncbi:MAG TPA: hypothetical protein C5S37_15100 [Methanophagales archaeon]|nr:hypothetical protein [Methanophagales archaeon]
MKKSIISSVSNMVNKEACQKLYREFKEDMPDLESQSFRNHWFERANRLRELGCWYHYEILVNIKKGRMQ